MCLNHVINVINWAILQLATRVDGAEPVDRSSIINAMLIQRECDHLMYDERELIQCVLIV